MTTPTPVDRELPSADWQDVIDLASTFATEQLRPIAAEYETESRFPREQFAKLGELGFLGMPYPPEVGGGDIPFQVYVQIIEELARGWLTVGLGTSVHTLSCHALANFGTHEQQQEWLPEMLGGSLLGAYCLSEPQSGSDAAALTTSATKVDGGYELTGTKAWITHSGVADFYTVMARTSPDRTSGISCFLVPAQTPGLTTGRPENKMGMRSSPTAQVVLDSAPVGASRLIGDEGQGFRIAMAALDAGRLGIAACAIGVAQAALDEAIAYAQTRQQFGKEIADFQGIRFLIADLATNISAARALLVATARRKDNGLPYSAQAAMTKLFATDMCMNVTTQAVQILGGAGYVEDFPVERYMREAKVLQIVEGTNQIQREVIGRDVLR